MKSFRILFAPSFKEAFVEEGKTILECAREAGVYVDSHCNGKGTCGKCRIRVADGNVNPLTIEESNLINCNIMETDSRLACMTRIYGDTTVFITGENILTSKTSEKTFSKRSDILSPAVKGYCIEVPSSEAGTGHAYLEDTIRILKKDFGFQDLACGLNVLQNLASALKDGKDKITVFIWMGKEILRVLPGYDKTCLGIALDIGTTTVAMYLCDLNNGDVIASGSVTNPQVLFGTDIMSRISYSSDNPGAGLKKMQTELISSVNALINKMTSANGYSEHQVMDMTVVGNTVMHHIFLGISPDSLGLWPFSPSIQGSCEIKARELGILINPSAYVHVFPIEAGFVGADNVGVLISEEPYKQDRLSLIIDLGTNGEIVLGDKDILYSSSCATGPALEGAHILNGMRASTGAIERVNIDPATFEVNYSVIDTGLDKENTSDAVKPVGICGSGIIDAVAQMFKTGIIDEDGAFSEKINTPRLRMGQSGVKEFVLAWGHETAIGRDIVLSQKDIRQIQLAKAALHGGCRVLMSRLNVTSVNRMVIAGAFGMHINKENALVIGLFPWCEPENIIMAGNAAGHGAYLALVNVEKRTEADRIAKTIIHVDLALEKMFQKEFMNALSIPYKSL